MKNGQGQLFETYLDSSIGIHCDPELIPTPGQYLLAHSRGSDSPLAVPVFFSNSTPNGFRSAPLLDSSWRPGTQLNIRGPLGHGFSIPTFARKVALIVFDDSPARLRGLISIAMKLDAEVVLVSNSVMEDMPEAVEVQPLQAMFEIFHWADYAAFDVARDNLIHLRENFGKKDQAKGPREAQVLVRAPMPCGAIAECGVCALTIRREWKMICKDGPVFELRELY
jgi:dihydroorotate dehydrogenase electron transfer subunit